MQPALVERAMSGDQEAFASLAAESADGCYALAYRILRDPQYYTPTMAAILRDLGVPTQIVEGFLPGERQGGTEVIRNNMAHAWVEVYFPGHGWIAFDPTGANDPARLPVALPS